MNIYKPKFIVALLLSPFFVVSLPVHLVAKVQLAQDGRAKAVIVSDDWAPPPTMSIARISVSTPQTNDLLLETFEAPLGQSIEKRGWTTSEGLNVVSYDGQQVGNTLRADSGGSSSFKAISEKNLSKPHAVTDESPLTLEYVLTIPADIRQDSWAYIRLHTAEGKRWVHGVYIASDGQKFFAPAAEPNDPDRVPLPQSAGNVLDLKMELHPQTVRWFWRNHGSEEAYQEFQRWGVVESVTITGVLVSSMNHEGNGRREREITRLDLATVDLKKYLDAVTDASFEIVSPDAVPQESSRIFVGDSPSVRSLLPDVDWDTLGTDAILIRTVGKDVVISGGRPRGKLYAIYTFLQDVVGCRWWAPGEITIPSNPNLSVATTQMIYEPPFKMRVHSGRVGSSHETRSWLRLSYDLNFDWGTHSIPHLLPKTLFLDHPDWFMYCKDDGDENDKYGYLASLKSFQRTIDTETERDDLDIIRQYIEIGRRTRRLPQQPCPNSKGGRAKITENVIAELEEKYPSWKYPEKIFWITQNDGRSFCQCEKCEAVREAEGSDSANWLLLVNEIAERLEDKYPDVLFGAFAYLHTEVPPKNMRPRKNVLIYAPLLTSNKRDAVWHYPKNTEYLKKWGQLTDHFYIWDYDANFRNFYQPHPNYLAHPESMQFFRKIGVTGVMVQGARGVAADLLPLRTWVNAQMMWDPAKDPQQLMKEFVDGYYGAAAPYVQQYIDLLLAAVHRKDDYWLGCYRTDTTGWLTLEDVNAAVALLDRAADAVQGEETLYQRVWMARRAIDFAWLDRYDEFQKDAAARGLILRVPHPSHVVDQLAPYRHAWGMFREGPRPNQFDVYFDRLRKQFPPFESN